MYNIRGYRRFVSNFFKFKYMKKNIFLTLALIIAIPLVAGPALAANTYTVQQVSWHNTTSDCWTIINNRVYNLTSYITSHPDRQTTIANLCGIDGSNSFNARHLGSSTVNSILMNYYVGDLTTDSGYPSIPANLVASVISSSQINLNWTASTDNLGITGYKVYRNNIFISTTVSNSFSDTGLSSATFYTYTVCAFDANGNVSNISNSVSATTLNYNNYNYNYNNYGSYGNYNSYNNYNNYNTTDLPSTPNNLRVYLNNNRAILHWDKSFDTAGIRAYRIVRNGTILGESRDNNYVDSNIVDNSTYSYYVVAIDNNGNLSANSNSVSLSAPVSTSYRKTYNTSYNQFDSIRQKIKQNENERYRQELIKKRQYSRYNNQKFGYNNFDYSR